ncbi:hypothetical protein GCM10022393_37520 [Aquimarina addita]|uniref:Thioredoxin n=1 Tax=Aquimarina addita TaxID=870485 RepID=A0ABP6UUJ8_9FLAO
MCAQSFNHEIINENKDTLLLGKINKQKLATLPYSSWFMSGYENYIPKQKSIDSIKHTLDQYTITLFLGTWCGDSKREVPRFYKILEESEFSLDRLTTIAVDRKRKSYKQSPGGEHEGLTIHRVPTIIFYKNGKEINRITESPVITLEDDIIAILNQEYTSKYQSVTIVDSLLTTKGLKYFSEKRDKIAKQLSTESFSELNTYGNVLFFADRKEEAIEICHLNTILYPKEANTYISLANKYVATHTIEKAITYYKKSLEFSDNENVSKKIKELEDSLN